MRKTILAVLILATAAFTKFGPPWISIEYPGNPYDQSAKDAFLFVHTYHHGTPVENPVSGTAEGIVRGERKTVSLEFKATSRPGVYSLARQWTPDGVWTLVIGGTQGGGENNTAYAIVEIDRTGAVSSVRVPTIRKNNYTVPAPVVMKDIERALEARSTR